VDSDNKLSDHNCNNNCNCNSYSNENNNDIYTDIPKGATETISKKHRKKELINKSILIKQMINQKVNKWVTNSKSDTDLNYKVTLGHSNLMNMHIQETPQLKSDPIDLYCRIKMCQELQKQQDEFNSNQ